MQGKKFFFFVLFLFLGYLSVTKINRMNKIDKCLDNGGKWNYETNRCEKDTIATKIKTTHSSGSNSIKK